jgi:hypothetical protein
MNDSQKEKFSQQSEKVNKTLDEEVSGSAQENNLRDAKGLFVKGHPASKPKGATNKFTDLKRAFLAVFEKIESESKLKEEVDSFYDWAIKNTKNQGLFYQMLSKMLPSNLDLTLPRDTSIKVISAIPRPKTEENK